MILISCKVADFDRKVVNTTVVHTTEHEISTAHNTKKSKNNKVSCFRTVSCHISIGILRFMGMLNKLSC